MHTYNLILTILGAQIVNRANVRNQSLVSPIYLRNLRCTGSEDTLLDCNSSPLGSRDGMCSHQNDVFIHCEGNTNQTYATVAKDGVSIGPTH